MSRAAAQTINSAQTRTSYFSTLTADVIGTMCKWTIKLREGNEDMIIPQLQLSSRAHLATVKTPVVKVKVKVKYPLGNQINHCITEL